MTTSQLLFYGGVAVILKTEEAEDGLRYIWSEQCNKGEGLLAAKQGEENDPHGIVGFVTSH